MWQANDTSSIAVHPAVLDDILDGRDQITRTPGEGAARFEDEPQMRMARTELPQQRNQRVAVVVGVGHQMAAAHVEPLDTIQILPEMPPTASSASRRCSGRDSHSTWK